MGIGGDFTSVGGVERRSAAAIDLATGEATAWDPAVAESLTPDQPGLVRDLWLTPEHVLLLGIFEYVNGVQTHDIALVDRATGALVPGFVSATTNPKGYVQRGLVQDDALTVVGVLHPPAGDLIAVLDVATGDLLPGFELAPNNLILALAAGDGGSPLYLGGRFVELTDAQGLHPRSHLAAVDPGSGDVLAWDPGANDDVEALELSGSVAFVAGDFTQLGGLPRESLGAVELASGQVTDWQADLDGPGSWGVSSLERFHDVLFVGGGFSAAGSRMAALNAATGAALDWNPGLKVAPSEMLVAGGRLLVGGSFDEVDGLPQWHLASLPMHSLSGARRRSRSRPEAPRSSCSRPPPSTPGRPISSPARSRAASRASSSSGCTSR